MTHTLQSASFTVFFPFFIVYAFKVSQLVVSSFMVRMVFVAIFIGCVIYVFVRGYQNAVKMVCGTKKKRAALIEWLSVNRKSVMSVLFGIWGLYYLSKVIFEPANNFETRIFAPLIDYIPLFVCLLVFGLLYTFSNTIRIFYLYKFSEEFREKFGIEKEKWYGKKYKAS